MNLSETIKTSVFDHNNHKMSVSLQQVQSILRGTRNNANADEIKRAAVAAIQALRKDCDSLLDQIVHSDSNASVTLHCDALSHLHSFAESLQESVDSEVIHTQFSKSITIDDKRFHVRRVVRRDNGIDCMLNGEHTGMTCSDALFDAFERGDINAIQADDVFQMMRQQEIHDSDCDSD